MEAVPSEPGTCSRQRYGHGHGHQTRDVPSVSKQLLSRPSHAIVRSLLCSGALVRDQVEVGVDGPSRFRTAFLARPPGAPRNLDPPSTSSSLSTACFTGMSLGRSILLEQQPFLASAAWSKISSTWGIWRFISFPAAAAAVVADCSF